jgi:cysteinyl-tRNA synthetase
MAAAHEHLPHNERVKSLKAGAATGQYSARYWLLGGSLTVDGSMSKSLGNFTTIKDLLKRYKPMPCALHLSGHYRNRLISQTALSAKEKAGNG